MGGGYIYIPIEYWLIEYYKYDYYISDELDMASFDSISTIESKQTDTTGEVVMTTASDALAKSIAVRTAKVFVPSPIDTFFRYRNIYTYFNTYIHKYIYLSIASEHTK